MKKIEFSNLSIPSGWRLKSNNALAFVQAAGDKSVAVNARSSVWVALKDQLAVLSHEKCWYCEAKQDRSDKHVDHFRPKNRVAEDDSHPGYWWLAFKESNLRYCCAFCNCRHRDKETGCTGGKEDAFPLLNPEGRVRAEGGDLSLEEPELLDPIVEGDSQLLYFESSGDVLPAYDATENPVANRRAVTSIAQYHLNHTAIRERRGQLYDEIRLAVEQAELAWHPEAKGPTLDELRVSTITRLIGFRAEAREYWTAAQSYLNTFADSEQRPWLDGVLSA